MRSIQIPGETLILARFGAHLSGRFGQTAARPYVELGLAADGVRITPSFYYDDVKVDDFGLHAPADTQNQLASVNVSCSLLHYDRDVAEYCQNESMGGAGLVNEFNIQPGFLAPAGALMGGRRPIYFSGNHFFSVVLWATRLPHFYEAPRFIKCHLTDPAFAQKLAANAEVGEMNFRVLPYKDPTVFGAVTGEGRTVIGPDNDGDLRTRTVLREARSSGAMLWDFVQGIDQKTVRAP